MTNKKKSIKNGKERSDQELYIKIELDKSARLIINSMLIPESTEEKMNVSFDLQERAVEILKNLVKVYHSLNSTLSIEECMSRLLNKRNKKIDFLLNSISRSEIICIMEYNASERFDTLWFYFDDMQKDNTKNKRPLP